MSLISTAYAQAASGPPAAGAIIGQFGMFALILLIFWVLVIRPQQKRAKDHRALIGSAKRGDEVVTGGGLIGKVVKVTDTEVEVELAPNVRVRALKSMLTDVRPKGAPVPANDAKA